MSECSIHTAECCFYAAILHETNLLWIRKWEASDLNYRWIIVHLGFVCAWLNCEALLYFSAYHYPVITITILPRLPPSFSIVCFVGRFEADYHHIIEQIKQSPCLYTTRHTYNTDVVVVISSHTLFESGLIVLAFFFHGVLVYMNHMFRYSWNCERVVRIMCVCTLRICCFV